jgi:uncharacterized protein YbaP (TraB family)
MIRHALATAALILGASHASAQCTGTSYLDTLEDDQRAAIAAAAADVAYGEGLIWEASKDDTQMVIVGTMHIFDPRLVPIYDSIGADIRAADLVLLEATPDDQRALQMMMANDPGMFLITEGPTLPDLLDEETWQLLSQATADRGVPAFMAAQMQPWYLSLVLAIPPCAMTELAAGIEGLDGMIARHADHHDVPVAALESFTTLFELFQEGTIDEQIDLLRLSLYSPDLQEQQFVAMLDAYFAQDVGQLWEMSRFAVAELPGLDPEEAAALFDEMEELLLNQRNRDWMPVITAAAAEHDNVMLAFGAGHLIGDYGILQLLENDGWTLTRRD